MGYIEHSITYTANHNNQISHMNNYFYSCIQLKDHGH